jgi:RND family efflux transporter MFP subunit
MRIIARRPFAVYCFSLLFIFLVGCSESRDQKETNTPGQEELVRVKVAEIKPWQEGSTRRFPGLVSPGRRAVLSTRVNGTIKAIEVEAGDHVRAGMVLAHIESRDIESAIAAAKEQLKAAEAAAAQAARNVSRLEKLYEEDLIARNRLEQALVRHHRLEARVEKSRAELQVQKVNRSYADITASFNGVVSEVVMDEGSFTGPGQPIVILEDHSTLQIDVPIPSKIADRRLSQDTISVIEPLTNESLPVRYVAVIPAIKGEAVGQLLRLSLEHPPETILPGQVVTVVLNKPEDKALLALPEGALIRRGQLTGVLVLEQKQNETFVSLRWIRTVVGERGESGFIPVSQGLDAGEIVVLNPSPDLKDGQQVLPDREIP